MFVILTNRGNEMTVKLKAMILGLLVTGVVACNGRDVAVVAHSIVTQTVPLPKEPVNAPAWSQEEMKCLTLTIYGEARNQPFHGQVAVGAAVVSRSLSPRWDKNLCSVVQQKGQFVGYWAAVSGGVHEPKAWKMAEEAARYATTGYPYLPPQYRKVFFFTVKGEQSEFHNKLQLVGYIQDHAFFSEALR